MRRFLLIPILVLLTGVAVAIDPPGDEAGNRKVLAKWLLDPEQKDRLARSLAAFRALPPEEQDKLRQLDRVMHEQDPGSQARLKGVMERYANWLARLNPADRDRILAAPPGPDRVRRIEELQEKLWRDNLPRASKDLLTKASNEDQAKLIEQLRKEDQERLQARLTARREVELIATLGPQPFGQEPFRRDIQAYVDDSLRPLLSDADEKRLANVNQRSWLRYFQTVYDLSERMQPLPFPGPAPPGKSKAVRRWTDLPADQAAKLRPMPPALRERIDTAVGKWPEFPVAIADVVRLRRADFPLNLLGPTNAEELPSHARQFVNQTLIAKLSPAEQRRLRDAEGQWPKYPELVVELAKAHTLTVPGLTLPGTREQWQRLKALRNLRGPMDK